jgi:hypothetical protein
MPDLACPYTLTTPGGTIAFNDGSADQFYITDIPAGLAGAPIRPPQDDVAYGDGGVSYNFWKGARHIQFEGVFLVQSAAFCSPAQVQRWNEMEEELRVALESIAALSTDTGTLVWTPTGALASNTLVVRAEVTLETAPDQGYTVRTFSFGLLADNPDWV